MGSGMTKKGFGIEYNDNRLALYCAQQGKCAVTMRLLEIGEIVCHHKRRRVDGGTDKYTNLVILSQDIHRLLHATQGDTIQKYLSVLNPTKGQLDKLNRLRKAAGYDPI